VSGKSGLQELTEDILEKMRVVPERLNEDDMLIRLLGLIQIFRERDKRYNPRLDLMLTIAGVGPCSIISSPEDP
jgi:hypothetical protein